MEPYPASSSNPRPDPSLPRSSFDSIRSDSDDGTGSEASFVSLTSTRAGVAGSRGDLGGFAASRDDLYYDIAGEYSRSRLDSFMSLGGEGRNGSAAGELERLGEMGPSVVIGSSSDDGDEEGREAEDQSPQYVPQHSPTLTIDTPPPQRTPSPSGTLRPNQINNTGRLSPSNASVSTFNPTNGYESSFVGTTTDDERSLHASRRFSTFSTDGVSSRGASPLPLIADTPNERYEPQMGKAQMASSSSPITAREQHQSSSTPSSSFSSFPIPILRGSHPPPPPLTRDPSSTSYFKYPPLPPLSSDLNTPPDEIGASSTRKGKTKVHSSIPSARVGESEGGVDLNWYPLKYPKRKSNLFGEHPSNLNARRRSSASSTAVSSERPLHKKKSWVLPLFGGSGDEVRKGGGRADKGKRRPSMRLGNLLRSVLAVGFDGKNERTRKRSMGKRLERREWTKERWSMWGVCYILWGLGVGLLVLSILSWFKLNKTAWLLTLANETVVILLTIAVPFLLILSTLLTSILLHHPTSYFLLTIYNLLLWPTFGLLTAAGYVAYKERNFMLEGKIGKNWSNWEGWRRASVQDALNCCGLYNAFVLSPPTPLCFPRTTLPGCKGPLISFERKALIGLYALSFGCMGLVILCITVSLVSGRMVDDRFGTGMTPPYYRKPIKSPHTPPDPLEPSNSHSSIRKPERPKYQLHYHKRSSIGYASDGDGYDDAGGVGGRERKDELKMTDFSITRDGSQLGHGNEGSNIGVKSAGEVEGEGEYGGPLSPALAQASGVQRGGPEGHNGAKLIKHGHGSRAVRRDTDEDTTRILNPPAPSGGTVNGSAGYYGFN